jgi:transcriptional regulator with XRE-family HTH domain
MNKYGLRLKELREKNGYTQESLAKRLNTSRSRIGMYEQGKRQPDFEMQEAIADLFNVSIDYLFGREDTIEKQIVALPLNPSEMKEAIDFYDKYKRLSPADQVAIQTLLKSLRPEP